MTGSRGYYRMASAHLVYLAGDRYELFTSPLSQHTRLEYRLRSDELWRHLY
jgi:hypothetical protein